jgi:hypothetical protein
LRQKEPTAEAGMCRIESAGSVTVTLARLSGMSRSMPD